jgi:hypothetical protein
MNKVMKVVGMSVFSIGLLIVFGPTAVLNYKAWMLVVGSCMYAAGVELDAIERTKDKFENQTKTMY